MSDAFQQTHTFNFDVVGDYKWMWRCVLAGKKFALCQLFIVKEKKQWKDIIAKTNDIWELEGDVRLLWNSQVINKCLEERQKFYHYNLPSTAFDSGWQAL